jgi:hypothetical protein
MRRVRQWRAWLYVLKYPGTPAHIILDTLAMIRCKLFAGVKIIAVDAGARHKLPANRIHEPVTA